VSTQSDEMHRRSTGQEGKAREEEWGSVIEALVPARWREQACAWGRGNERRWKEPARRAAARSAGYGVLQIMANRGHLSHAGRE
jgi:hypothetical protein